MIKNFSAAPCGGSCEKGCESVKILRWALLLPFTAGACLFRRWMLTAFDAEGLPLPLAAESLAMPALLVAAALVYALLARSLPAQRTLCAEMSSYFPFGNVTLTAVVGACLLYLAELGLSLANGAALTALLPEGLLAVGVVCLLAAVAALRKRKEFPGVILLVPVCALVLRLIFFYREHTADPFLRDYYVELLALAALTLFLLEFAAFAFRGGAPRLFVPLGYITFILCAASLASVQLPDVGASLGDMIFYGAGALLTLGLLGAADFDL